jgi:phosphate starvation-inducible PhoH-like protein
MEVESRRIRKEKKKKAQNKGNVSSQEKLNFQLKTIIPLTKNQQLSFDAYEQGKNLMLHGIAGTGKSFISLYLALYQILSDQNTSYEKIVIVRSVVPTRDMGFLPGNSREKSKVYEAPYYAICTELFDRGDAYEYLKQKGLVEFISTSFVRGITFNNTIVIVDEMQNMTGHELDSIITRIGKNCKVIFSGDFRQSDFTRGHEKDGLKDFMQIIQRIKSFVFIDFTEEDIVRSNLVRSYIIEKDRLGINY